MPAFEHPTIASTPPPINRWPLGLLGFLGIKNGGRYPQHLSELLLPTWDQAFLYLNAAAEYSAINANPPAVGNTPLFGVPLGECWYVHNFSLQVATPAGGAYSGHLTRNNAAVAPAVVLVSLCQDQVIGASAHATFVPTQAQAAPMFLTPGEQLGVSSTVVTGAVTAYAAIRFTRMPV